MSGNQNGSFSNPSLRIYRDCAPGCTSCDGPFSNSCTMCAGGISPDPVTKTCPSCPSNQVMFNNTCTNCHYSCSTCSNPSVSGCLTCASGRYASGGFCTICAQGQFYNQNGNCVPNCQPDRTPDQLSRICCYNCETCWGPNIANCLTCPPRRRMVANACEPCGAFCATCSGPNQNECLSCFGAA